MKYAAISTGLALSILLAGCNNEPEETPDITEAIPLDDGMPADEASGGESDADAQGSLGEGADGAAPSSSGTMESGSNPPGSEIRLEGSKLQKADPVN